MDISETGQQIGEKLFVLLNETQKHELTKYVPERKEQFSFTIHSMQYVPVSHKTQVSITSTLTEIQVKDLYFCLEERTVLVRRKEIDLTVRESDAFHLLISNHRRVITFEVISERVWGYDCEITTPKAIHNLMSRIKQKLKIAPDIPDYISSVRGVGINSICNPNREAVCV